MVLTVDIPGGKVILLIHFVTLGYTMTLEVEVIFLERHGQTGTPSGGPCQNEGINTSYKNLGLYVSLLLQFA